MILLKILFGAPFMYSWYITVPEALYMTLIGFKLLGPLGLTVWPAYSIALAYYPVPTMIAVGTVAAIHLAVILFKNIAGDRLAKDKEVPVGSGANGIPRMSGSNQETQEALDNMHKEAGEAPGDMQQHAEEAPGDVQQDAEEAPGDMQQDAEEAPGNVHKEAEETPSGMQQDS